MVLAGFGLDLAEAALRTLCDCTLFGTHALKAVDATRRLSFPNTAKHTLAGDELEALVNNGNYPIVFVATLPIEGLKGEHTMVVIACDQVNVVVYDPLRGERRLPRTLFDTAWAMMHNLAILVQR